MEVILVLQDRRILEQSEGGEVPQEMLDQT